MINYTITKRINEMEIFNSVKNFLFNEDIKIEDFDYETLYELPKDVQRLIFAKVGAMMIDYAGSEDF